MPMCKVGLEVGMQDVAGNADYQLVARAQRGDEEALRQICIEYEPHVARLARWMLRGTQGADDVTQETFLRVLKSLREGKTEIRQLKPWILRIAYTTALKYFHDRRRSPGLPTDFPLQHSDAEQELARKERHILVERAIYRLPKQQRLAIVGFFHEQSDEEIAADMGVRPVTVRVHRHAAYKVLREVLGGTI
jgi:RNA polymerase sigma-70 factor, ECF subfamily